VAQNASEHVLDASAVLAMLLNEPGSEFVAEIVPGAAINAANLAEIVSKLIDYGYDEQAARGLLTGFHMNVVPLDEELAYVAASLRSSTMSEGLSLGDRACLATAQTLKAVAVTTDRKWAKLDIGVKVQLAR
jgi:ribonuclease VapC